MSLVTLTLLLLTASITLTRCQESDISDLETTTAPIKLDKNIRRALLKALTDLDAESAEQHKDESDNKPQRDTSSFEGVAKKNLNKDLGTLRTTYSFKSFPSDDDLPGEDKLQNSSFVDSVRYVTLRTPVMNIEKATQDDARSFHVQNVVLPEKDEIVTFGSKDTTNPESEEKTTTPSSKSFSVNKVESLTLKPIREISESLTGSASNGFATANALIAPKPTESTLPLSINSNVTLTGSNDSKDKTEEVKIFQAPLVAAFTVQQDEQGVPKSVVPIFRSPTDGQALTLQEQLEFKQRLLEKQLAELHQQQVQQTQFLVRQQHLYEQQLRQKQQQQLYAQEQARIKQLEEETKIKLLQEQRAKQLEEQRIKFEEQRLNRFQSQQQRPLPQNQFFFEQSNNLLTFQPPVDSNVHLQPALTLEVPNAASPPQFQSNFQQPEQLRFQTFRPQQQNLQQLQVSSQIQQPQQLQQLQKLPQSTHLQQSSQLHPSQQLHQTNPQQQRLQQSFANFATEFQPPLASTTRFNRQEAFNAIGNFGFNTDNKITPSRNNFGFQVPQRPAANFYNPFVQYRQTKPPTPAKQIQHLLYQSGIAGDLSNVQGIGNHEDLNIVSKVLALNVGAVPNKSTQFVNTNQGSGSFGKTTV